MLMLLSACAPTASSSDLVSPNVFVRGVQLSNGTRYTATFIKPTDSTALRDVLVEITLPTTVALTEMTVPRQTSSAEVRENGTTRTLVWRVAHVGADEALDAFAFTVAQPLTIEVEFYMVWHDATNAEHIEHFTDFPPVQAANQAEAEISVTQSSYVPIGETGVQVSAQVQNPPLDLHVRVLPASFNPPAEYGALWWCSIIEVAGVPAGETIDVVAPLRRPIAPFTPLSLFRQNADGSWSPAPGLGVVTADGLFVVYAHPGGVIATGGDEILQPAVVQLTSVNDGSSNTIVLGEATATPAAAGIVDGNSNTIVLGEATATPAAGIVDGSSNTIVLGEATATPAAAGIVDGNSNTIVLGEATATPAAGIVDGSSNTIVLGEATATPTAAGIVDGSSNTIVLGEATATPTAAGIVDGNSNTIVLGEATATPAAGIVDGSSNTIVLGEATVTPTANNLVRLVTATPTSRTSAVLTPTRTPNLTITLPPIIALNPTPFTATPAPLGSDSVRVVILIRSSGAIQCQAGGLSCATLRRTTKK